MTTPTISTDDEVTERTAAFLRHPDNRLRDGYETPCGEWIAGDAVDAHAAKCSACRTEGSHA